MPTIQIPYHEYSLPLTVEEPNLKAVLAPRTPAAEYDTKTLLSNAIINPIGSPRLSELARGKKKVLIVTSDQTRPLPRKISLPLLAGEVRLGAPDAEISYIVAVGTRRVPTPEELITMFGEDFLQREKLYIHNASDSENLRRVAELPSGNVLFINRIAQESDLIITEGCVTPHFFAGFSGGRKSILPGISAESTIRFNHAFMSDEKAVSGTLAGNPIHSDMVNAARAAGVSFILNVVVNEDGGVIAAFAGDLEQAHEAGAAFIKSFSEFDIVTGDIVVAGSTGHPLDQMLCQPYKSLVKAESYAKDDGVIVLVSAISPDAFAGLISAEKIAGTRYFADGFAELLKLRRVIFVTKTVPAQDISLAGFIPAESPDEALKIAYALKGKDAQVVVLPDSGAVFF